MTVNSDYLFVYGTLCKGASPNRHEYLLPYCKYVAEASCAGALYWVGAYPGFVASSSAAKVFGEVYEIHAKSELFARLDDYEQCSNIHPEPREYRRETTRIQLENGAEIDAWIYVYNWPVNQLQKIASGDFRLFQAQERSKK